MEEQQQQKQQQEGPIPLDWKRLLPDEDPPPPELVVMTPSSIASDQFSDDGFDFYSDHKLRESIQSMAKTLEGTGKNLKDGGAKLRVTIDRYREELSRREHKRLHQDVEEDQKKQSRQATSSSAVGEGVCKDLREEISSQAQSQSSFASCFVKKMKDDTNCTDVGAFKKELSRFKHCNNRTTRGNGESKGKKRHRSSSRRLSFQCPSNLSKRGTSSDDKTWRATSTLSLQNIGRNLSRCYPKVKDASLEIHSDGSRSRKGQPIVLDDDDDDNDYDELHIVEQTENGFAEHLKEAKIYFPSRDDPECVEICYTDTDCLAPEGYLTSTIMNFYIRYLQQQASLTNRSLSDYHFFNTYFYKKLKEAVSYKQSDREMIFARFRRWWKGVNIFQKAYVLIPIHEDLHWSLIIICIPDKEDELGPIVLHLDSLGLHSSKSVFDNIKSYLIEERNYMDRECVSSDVSIADRIWKCLPRRIESQIIAVPQQKNEYDCGLFVLYFIKRFMEEAPERLKKKDLAMFGKRWFKPEEASGLRVKIRKLLVEKLQSSIRHNCKSESPPPSSAGTATDCVETTEDLSS
ncbi:ubiquitin-like-specific protease 1D isoform X2 [Abrus precatorius]|uniref:Ubiquitin-like-specific protease 1D isoform X2 n=1 Tax=Abrus precatorius TaxID=3816 RepID=A0A8B8KV68_ABRPR|nr:ubiquitin-like-specific protease 1D isoform X2 [Abrus precatorius]